MQLKKSRTYIKGFDEITRGGVPTGRPTLVCGSAGCGKTLFGMEFLVRGAVEGEEPGVLFTFEERAEDVAVNVDSLGFDVPGLIERDLLRIDQIDVDAAEIAETGDYSLDGLFIRLRASIEEIGARRVVLDTIEALFGAFTNHMILRSELNRLFRWLKDRGLTTVITAERGRDTLTRYGVEEYVSDCVVVLEHRVSDQVSTRLLRILKYRGTAHGTNEYPFLIDEAGFSIMPITAIGLDHSVSESMVSSGVGGLDEMLNGRGYYRGSTVLISGTTGTGKSSFANAAAIATAAAGERAIIFSFEESSPQMQRNMRSIGFDLAGPIEQGLLQIHCGRPTLTGFEQHLVRITRDVDAFQPSLVVIDPISSFSLRDGGDAVAMLVVRLIDMLKSRGITAVMTYLAHGLGGDETTVEGISSLADSWIRLATVEHSGERNRTLHVLKSRGMGHSNQLSEFVIAADGIAFVEPYIGPEEALTGAARIAQQAKDRAAEQMRQQLLIRKRRTMERLQQRLEAEVAALTAKMETDLDEVRQELLEAEVMDKVTQGSITELGARRARKPGSSSQRGSSDDI